MMRPEERWALLGYHHSVCDISLQKTEESLERDEEEEEMQPFNGSYPTLQEEAPAISGCAEESDNFPTQEEGKEG